MTAQGSAYMRFRRALDRGNATEALSAAADLQFVGLAEALELTLLLADQEPDKFGRTAGCDRPVPAGSAGTSTSARARRCSASWRRSRPNALAATALAELLSRRRSCERITDALVRWSRAA